MNTLSIGQLAAQAGVHVETVRYYERRGLLPAPPRRASGYRQYSTQDLAYLRFIRRAKTLGFSLTEIADLLALRVAPETTCADVRAQAERKLADVDAKIRTLEHIKGALTQLVADCSGQGPMSACPILEALETQELQEGSPVNR
jgi:MerR family transcriptional regulator, copper efflux regulator